MTEQGAALDDALPPVADTPMWLSHHWPEGYERCAVVGGMHLCRRCLVLYPGALVAGILVSLGSWWNSAWDPFVLWVFPFPGVVEFIADNLRLVRYSPVRQMLLTAPGAFAAGLGYTRYLDHTTDSLVWSVCIGYSLVSLAAVVAGVLWRRRRAKMQP